LKLPSSPDNAGAVFLRAEWRMLAMLNFEVDPKVLLNHLPTGTELDQWNGKTFITLVGFRFLKTRVFGVPLPFHRNFEEVNLRFYVRRRVGSEVRRGVVFIREIVPRWAIARVANLLYNERYVALPMSHKIQSGGDRRLSVEYSWKANRSGGRILTVVKDDPALPEDGSEEQFITEHYWGYAAQRDHGCMGYRVEHPAWKVWTAERATFDGDMKELYGHDLASVIRTAPCSAFLAEGSEVTVHRGRRL
jgi:uncharacterized protein YqjF (DUF2071 family)